MVAVEHQWMAQELESAFDDKAFFRVRNRAELEQLARAMHERGHPRFTLVRWDETQESVVNAGSVRIRMRSRGRFGSYVLIECEVDQGQAPGSDRPQQRGPNTNSPS